MTEGNQEKSHFTNTNADFNRLLDLASRGDTQGLKSAGQLSDRSFHLVLKIVSMKRYANLFESVFSQAIVADFASEQWFSFMCAAISKAHKHRFMNYFSAEKFTILSPTYKNAITRRFATEFDESNMLAFLFSLGATVDIAMLDEVDSDRPGFELVIQYADNDVVTRWVEKRLCRYLANYKHAANYSPAARNKLKRGVWLVG